MELSSFLLMDSRGVVTRGWVMGGNREDGHQRVQTHSSKTSKFWGFNVQHCVYS